MHVAVAEIIREDDDDVWLCTEDDWAKGEEEKESFHDRER
jgi:hypothetical protein